jgi:hypothetical protein
MPLTVDFKNTSALPKDLAKNPGLEGKARRDMRQTPYKIGSMDDPTAIVLESSPHDHVQYTSVYSGYDPPPVKAHSQLKLVGLRDLLMRFAEHSGHRDSGRFSAPA